MKKNYAAPALSDLGTLRELTEMPFNKVGPNTDVLSTVANQVVGSLVGV